MITGCSHSIENIEELDHRQLYGRLDADEGGIYLSLFLNNLS